MAALVGRPMAAAVAAAWMVVAGVVELTIGFRAGIAALRWAGLASCLLLIARLYLVDLASTPIFVRVVLLFVTGLILVGVGIGIIRLFGIARCILKMRGLITKSKS